ncbi:hypothetical protein V3C99_016949 [Haemonchus contortus]|uniref:MCC-bdg_PDZ domain-containing protein n=1 Tax=Haemonchus contortus TaxID=6289 RepID=A0A7I4YY46_HAECO
MLCSNNLALSNGSAIDLTRTAEEKTSELQSCQKELSSVRNEIMVLEEKLVEVLMAQSKAAHLEVQLRNASREPTDAGDETQIIHLLLMTHLITHT